MVSSAAATVAQYLEQLPEPRRAVVAAVRDLVNAHLPSGYVETMAYGMIGWTIPLARYPDTYNGQPLGYAGLAAQKNSYSLYLNSVYGDAVAEQSLRDDYTRVGKRLDIGKSCLRFKSLDDLLPDAIATIIASTSVDAFIAGYERTRSGDGRPC